MRVKNVEWKNQARHQQAGFRFLYQKNKTYN